MSTPEFAPTPLRSVFLGVDVGTGSTRAVPKGHENLKGCEQQINDEGNLVLQGHERLVKLDSVKSHVKGETDVVGKMLPFKTVPEFPSSDSLPPHVLLLRQGVVVTHRNMIGIFSPDVTFIESTPYDPESHLVSDDDLPTYVVSRVTSCSSPLQSTLENVPFFSHPEVTQQIAMEEEMMTLEQSQTWELVSLLSASLQLVVGGYLLLRCIPLVLLGAKGYVQTYVGYFSDATIATERKEPGDPQRYHSSIGKLDYSTVARPDTFFFPVCLIPINTFLMLQFLYLLKFIVGVFDECGKLLGSASSPIQIWKEGDCIEQSSTDIWHAICAAVRAACSLADVAGEEVTGLGFAATCSLVAVDSAGAPVTVSWSGDTRRNVIVWMDHRAVKQAERINSCNSPVLQYCGGSLSPEMQPPKLLWVKENLQESWSLAFRWMDLSDWLSYKATGDDTRSLCTTVCKWTYLGHAHMHQVNEDSRDMEACGWDDEFWEEIGLGDLVDGHHAKIGRSVAFPGHALGSGLTPDAAKARNLLYNFQELGLVPGTPVGTSLIDAHAGGVGVMESVPDSDSEAKEFDEEAICRRMVLVCGTSTCHMAVSRSKLFIPGVWGPFWSGILIVNFKVVESSLYYQEDLVLMFGPRRLMD
ncbi:hypothetical protein RJ639_003103 [Escallonia herrerae]|uniref:FGGY carbohydrate kinase domain-containing protein n=1 Tax=Escallonia herrerae TaxID=1293975 RepID=A0AA88W7V8_9ASTE|nr:hypothetical protein RJ639_003103 [Escallonia herrerae]